MIVLVFTAALAASGPKDLPYRGTTTTVPVTQGKLDDWLSGPACVRAQGDRLPTPATCTEPLGALFVPADCATGGEALLCRATPAAAPTATTWGLHSLDLTAFGGTGTAWFLTDRAVHATLSYRLIDEASALDAAQPTLDAMVRACTALPTAKVATTLHLGCAKLEVLDRHDPAARPIRTKDSFASRDARGAGAFFTDLDGTPSTRCDADRTELIAMEVTSISEVCAAVVFPEAVRRRDALLRARASDDTSTAADQRNVTLRLGGVERRRDELLRLLADSDAMLAQAEQAITASRALTDAIGPSTDQRWIDLLTELGRLDAEHKECQVQVKSAQPLAPALASEAAALRDKLTLLDLHGDALRRLDGELTALDQHTTRDLQEVELAWGRARELHRSAAFLHGRLQSATEHELAEHR